MVLELILTSWPCLSKPPELSILALKPSPQRFASRQNRKKKRDRTRDLRATHSQVTASGRSSPTTAPLGSGERKASRCSGSNRWSPAAGRCRGSLGIRVLSKADSGGSSQGPRIRVLFFLPSCKQIWRRGFRRPFFQGLPWWGYRPGFFLLSSVG